MKFGKCKSYSDSLKYLSTLKMRITYLDQVPQLYNFDEDTQVILSRKDIEVPPYGYHKEIEWSLGANKIETKKSWWNIF